MKYFTNHDVFKYVSQDSHASSEELGPKYITVLRLLLASHTLINFWKVLHSLVKFLRCVKLPLYGKINIFSKSLNNEKLKVSLHISIRSAGSGGWKSF